MLEHIARFANGDARIALSTLEMVVLNGAVSDNTITVTRETLEQCTAQKSLLYDKMERTLQSDLRPAQIHAKF